jgi:hypothetical protein
MQAKLTCYIDEDVLKAVKHAAVDRECTVGAMVEASLVDALGRRRANVSRVAVAVLNSKGYRTKRGKAWSTVSVSRLLKG